MKSRYQQYEYTIYYLSTTISYCYFYQRNILKGKRGNINGSNADKENCFFLITDIPPIVYTGIETANLNILML